MRLSFTIAVVLLINAAAAHAQDWPRLNVLVGAQLAEFGTDVRLDASATVLGSTIDFERDLGFNESAGMVWAGAVWRASRRNQVEVVWTRVERDVFRRQLPRAIRFGENTFEAGTEVEAFLDTWFIGASYRVAIVATPAVEIGPLIGLVAMNLSTGINLPGSASAPGGEAPGSTSRREATFTAPALVPGAFVNVRAHPRVTIRARGGYVSADFGEIDGRFAHAQAGADLMLTRWLGVGGDYSFNELSVGVDGDDFRGDVRYSFNGPHVYAVLAF